jgi:hypothetical protein
MSTMTSASPQELASLLPWGIIAESLDLEEVLQTRLTCHSLCEALAEHVSPSTCSRYLAMLLEQRNLFVIPDVNYWVTETARESEATVQLFSTAAALDSLLRMIKVMKYLPKQAAVAFNGKHGRHLRPLRWDEETKATNLFSHEPCQRKPCVTCKFRIPVRTATSSSAGRRNNIDDHLEFRKRKAPLDLHSYHTTCVPNLPRDVHCPMCRTTDQRTLVLSEVAYRSDSRPVNRPDHVLLTWTPHEDQVANENSFYDDDIESDDEPSDNSVVVVRRDDDDEPSSKRHKIESDDDDDDDDDGDEEPVSFPPLYDDMAIPSTTNPIRLRADCKHAISIHCSHCGEFGVVGPAAVCWNPEFPCHERGHNLSDSYQTVLGGVLVRSQCSNSTSPGGNCQRSTLCESCTRGPTIHSAYLEDTRGTSLLSGMCHLCHEPFCSDHVEFDGSRRNGRLIPSACRKCACPSL